jgi:RNAse (barnase) inhibitor barstar
LGLAAQPSLGESGVKTSLTIDGNRFETLEGFYDEFSRQLIPGCPWGRNLGAFNDILRGGFGTPEEGFVLVWANHQRSRESLGYAETVRQLRLRLKHCHPANVVVIRADLEAAKSHEGPTVFDWLVEIIRDHGPGGEQAENGVDLLLR